MYILFTIISVILYAIALCYDWKITLLTVVAALFANIANVNEKDGIW